MPLPLINSQVSRPKIRHIIAIAAGKGGVGKSTVAVNMALALKEQGYKVGVLDADLYGPSIQKMLPCDRLPSQKGEWLFPGLAMGLKIISMAHFSEEGKAKAVRAPIANSIITQFLERVEWEGLDFLLIDFPPGTGDIQITLAQKAKIEGAVMVTTPQDVAGIDVLKAIDLFKAVHIPILGVIENMSYLKVEGREEPLKPFGSGGGDKIARSAGAPLLARVPIEEAISSSCDRGVSLFTAAGAEEAKAAFLSAAKALVSIVERSNEEGMVDFKMEWRNITHE
ncbi:Mrp/NBP35 family ATP-binding protein [Estrella lausannensis]|uniref:Iron-sulfur cluster carrier protein n=1 Tax=Estrella lausannensis TaxID=483423 RepID=A0A0H5DS00_9BACT|nr:Mrp/NBP35 family ATP-binding protein [Estrella lausannensis]CRX39033.1 hypothetical protein ELAC_1706 [Estrella lausannensis]